MIRRWGVLLGLVAALWITAQPERIESAQNAAGSAQPTSEMYQNVYNGWKWWHVYCYRCHGQDAVATTLAPTLIDTRIKLTLPDFLRKVRNGSPEKGMQAWDKRLDDRQITQLYYYVAARADKVLPPGRPDEVGPKGGRWIPPEGWPKAK